MKRENHLETLFDHFAQEYTKRTGEFVGEVSTTSTMYDVVRWILYCNQYVPVKYGRFLQIQADIAARRVPDFLVDLKLDRSVIENVPEFAMKSELLEWFDKLKAKHDRN